MPEQHSARYLAVYGACVGLEIFELNKGNHGMPTDEHMRNIVKWAHECARLSEKCQTEGEAP